ncbi:LysR family transcriptional regulator [Sagittula sp. S175]|uniref:LysR family transcriptional regulator n=1 Tax=Sagittula sp. S175 TaxID=3415129 RepID=UPI003C799B65
MEEVNQTGGLGRTESSGLVFRQLEIFHAIMTTGSVNAASRLLNVSQPSLSRSLQRLEDQLGLPLFHRHRKRLLPSEEARRLFGEVDPIIAQMRALTDSIAHVIEGQTSLFRFAHTQSVGRQLVSHAIRLMKTRQPELKVFLDALPRMQHVDYLLGGKGECLVSLALLDHPLLVSRVIARAPLVAAFSADHPLATLDMLRASDLAGVDLISFEHDGPHFAAISTFLADAPTLPREVAFIRFADAGISLAYQGVGVALLDSFTLAGNLPDGLVTRPLENAPEFIARLYWNGERPGSRFVQAFGDALVRAVALYPDLTPVKEPSDD